MLYSLSYWHKTASLNKEQLNNKHIQGSCNILPGNIVINIYLVQKSLILTCKYNYG
jgi:hypothetical protein